MFSSFSRAGGRRSAQLCQTALRLCHDDAFGTVFQPAEKPQNQKSTLCLQGFRAVFEMTALLLHWYREQTTNFL
jgi:hypothetical protein